MAVIKETTKIESTLLEQMVNSNLVITKDNILQTNYKTIKLINNGDFIKTLGQLDSIMKQTQGSTDKQETRAYFKAKKFAEKLTQERNKQTEDRLTPDK